MAPLILEYSLLIMEIQWNLPIKDTLRPAILFTMERLPLPWNLPIKDAHIRTSNFVHIERGFIIATGLFTHYKLPSR